MSPCKCTFLCAPTVCVSWQKHDASFLLMLLCSSFFSHLSSFSSFLFIFNFSSLQLTCVSLCYKALNVHRKPCKLWSEIKKILFSSQQLNLISMMCVNKAPRLLLGYRNHFQLSFYFAVQLISFRTGLFSVWRNWSCLVFICMFLGPVQTSHFEHGFCSIIWGKWSLSG